MKINRLETHDRLLHLRENQAEVISAGATECLKNNPLSLAIQARCPYVYLFAHPRTADDGVNKRMLWQPRMTKPKAQTNSYLFRALSNTDNIEVCWMIPPKEMWGQYKKGNVTESSWVEWSIKMYLEKKEELEKPFPDDVTQERFKNIMLEIAKEEQERVGYKMIPS